MYKILKNCKEITRQELIFRTYVFLLANTLLTKRISACPELLVALCLYGFHNYHLAFSAFLRLSVIYSNYVQGIVCFCTSTSTATLDFQSGGHSEFPAIFQSRKHCIQSKVSSALGMLTRKIFLFSFFSSVLSIILVHAW